MGGWLEQDFSGRRLCKTLSLWALWGVLDLWKGFKISRACNS